MGGCCSKEEVRPGRLQCKEEEEEFYDGEEEEEEVDGTRARLKGSCTFASMYTQRGWKGVNQDAMTMWEDFAGEKDTIFCGVFDGHGPLGHKVAGCVRDALPSKLSSELKSSQFFDPDNNDRNLNQNNVNGNDSDDSDHFHDVSDDSQLCFSSWKAIFVEAFEKMDKELSQQASIDCFCSGSTAVSIVKQREHLMIANLGDSRAVLCTRDDKNQPVPVQLTVDLKPNVPSEAERIKSCKGRVFALKEEPDVHRLWLPNDDSPGLAMARAFGDFCLKDFGLISTPQVSYRKLSEKDEFVVLATDGVWDVLSNKEVVKIVSSVSHRSDAAKILVDRAVRAWRYKHPTSKVDDCAVICLFLNLLPTSTMPTMEAHRSSGKSLELSLSESFKTARSGEVSDLDDESTAGSKEGWTALEGVSRVNSLLKLPRFTSVLSWRKRSVKGEENEMPTSPKI
ncbi:probable protein phosphatase 2C 73 [Elaeis guineensis]|uniref:protein-serine/threonine phosphatase n=1 Tax=Elaeis guineensis var. tenera TaxID=51953 RepID=A0A6I9RG02_ELAGV|nr:probable protein phosphatase 2C 73 [Elaeis guineensis]